MTLSWPLLSPVLSEKCALPSGSKHSIPPGCPLFSVLWRTCYTSIVITALTTLHFKCPSSLLDCELLRGLGDALSNLASNSHLQPSQSHSRLSLNTVNVTHFSFWENIFWQRHQNTIFSTMPVITFLIRGITLKPFVGSFGILILYFSWQQMIIAHLFWTLSLTEYWHLTFLVVYSFWFFSCFPVLFLWLVFPVLM